MDRKDPPYPVQPPAPVVTYPVLPQPLNVHNLPGSMPQPPPPYDNQQAAMPIPMSPPPAAGPPVSVTTTSLLVGTQPNIHFGPDAQALTCPHCHAQVITKVESKASTKTHLFALLLCCCICWPCAWMPYCMDSCQNRNHSCPNCGAFLGTYDN